MKINGKEFQMNGEKALADVFSEYQIETPKGIAVAVNNQVIPRLKWSEKIISLTDEITIIKATQGG
jgi:sulfur carrier protein